MTRFSLSLFLALFVATITPSFADPAMPSGWLRFGNGDQVKGHLLDSEELEEGRVRWQVEGFATPFLVDVHEIRSLSYENTSDEAKTLVADSLFLVELVDQQRLIGQITNCDGETLTLDSISAGEIKFSIDGIVSIQPWDTSSGSIVLGEALLREQPNAEAWDARGNRLSTSAQNARLTFEDVLPADATVELEIGWEEMPNFEITLGVDADNPNDSLRHAVRLAVWSGELVMYCESDDYANVVRIASIDDLESRIKLVLNLKRSSNLVTIRSDAKAEVLNLELSNRPPDRNEKNPSFGADLQVRNRRGSFRLDSVLVMPLVEWQSTNAVQNQPTLYLTSGEQAVGAISSVENGVWTIESKESSRTIAGSEIALVRFEPRTAMSIDETSSSVRVVTEIGEHFHGKWSGVASNAIRLESTIFKGNTDISTEKIVRVDSARIETTSKEQTLSALRCKLENDNGVMTGVFAASESDAETPLAFQPEWGTQAALLSEYRGQAVFGTIPRGRSTSDVERRARERARQLREAQAAANRRVEGVARFNMMNMFTNAFSKDAKAAIQNPRAIYLASGEIVPCSSVQIDEENIIFESPMTDQNKIPRREVLAVRLSSGSYEPVMEEVIRERLMTVPRVNKKDPPSHLLVASNGDLLRCQLKRMNETHIFIESRLEKIRIARDLVSQIIRLQSPEGEDDSKSKSVESGENALEVLAIQKNASRVGFVPNQLTDEQLIGNHPYLGRSSVKWSEVALLSFNRYLTVDSTKRPYSNWRLADAPEPIITDSEGGSEAGKSSKLVGQPAPDFKLELLSGAKFDLKQNRGKVVVLDFWASWCGPCMQAMPVIDETVKKFDAEEVRLVAVNLQEPADAINRTLQRLKIEPEVALDIDGVAALLYEADAIPQTVVIDPRGVVTRVFVGSGGNLGEQLENAISESLSLESTSS